MIGVAVRDVNGGKVPLAFKNHGGHAMRLAHDELRVDQDRVAVAVDQSGIDGESVGAGGEDPEMEFRLRRQRGCDS